MHRIRDDIRLPWTKEQLGTCVKNKDVFSGKTSDVVECLFQSIQAELRSARITLENTLDEQIILQRSLCMSRLIHVCKKYSEAFHASIPHTKRDGKLDFNPEQYIEYFFNELRTFIGDEGSLKGKIADSTAWLELQCFTCGKFCEIMVNIAKSALKAEDSVKIKDNVKDFKRAVSSVNTLSSCHKESSEAFEILVIVVTRVISIMGQLRTLPAGSLKPMADQLEELTKTAPLKPLPVGFTLLTPESS